MSFDREAKQRELREQMKYHGIRQRELAEAMNCSRAAAYEVLSSVHVSQKRLEKAENAINELIKDRKNSAPKSKSKATTAKTYTDEELIAYLEKHSGMTVVKVSEKTGRSGKDIMAAFDILLKRKRITA